MMNNEAKLEMLNISTKLHSQIEASYLNHPANKHNDEWLEKQRLLLADMALHLLQTSISPEELKLDRLRDNIHAILTIADQFLPNADLKKATEKIYQKN